MATVNPWKKFKSLLPDDAKQVVTVQTVNADGTSVVTLRGGDTLRVFGDSVQAGNRAIIQSGKIVGPASALTFTEITV